MADSSVPLAVFEPWAVISRNLNGGVMVKAEPPPVPGVMVKEVLDVYSACMSLVTRLLPDPFRSVMLATAHTSSAARATVRRLN